MTITALQPQRGRLYRVTLSDGRELLLDLTAMLH